MFKGSIIIVEDDDALREQLNNHFSSEGYCVQAESCSHEALSSLEASKFDVMIADLTTAGVDGRDLLYHMRSQYPMTRLIMVSGFIDLDQLLKCAQNQIETIIFKPLEDLSEITQAVEKAVEHHNLWRRKFNEYENNFKNGST